MVNRKGKFKVKNGSGSYDQVMLETQLGQVVDSPIKSLERSTRYEQNDVVAEQTCKGTFLVCTTAGTTAASAPSGYSSVAEGGSVTDGTAVFTAHRFNNLANIAAIIAHNALETAHENRFKLFEKISDLADDIIKKLTLTTAITAITALETNSWFGQLLKMALTASGVKYNIAQNGYICFGSFFGGLIIQWIITKEPMVNWPIAFTKCYGAIPVSYGQIGDKSTQKREYGMRGAIAFDEIGIDSWYVRTADGSIVYNGYVGYFGIGIVKGNTDH